MLSQEPESPRLSGAASDLVTHGNAFCLAALQTSASAAMQCAILGFYEQAALLASKAPFLEHARIVVPPSPLVYMLFFGSDPGTISRLSGILARYKEGFQAVMARSRTGYSIDYINGFNGFLMDICNCLWRGRAFNAKDANAHGCLAVGAVVDELAAYAKEAGSGVAFGSMFTLSASPALGLLATDHLRALEEAEMEQGTGDLEVRHGGPVSKASLAKLAKEGGLNLSWDDFRLGVLGHLEDHGMGGVGELMSNTMTTLMKRT
jgi:centromere protein I